MSNKKNRPQPTQTTSNSATDKINFSKETTVQSPSFEKELTKIEANTTGFKLTSEMLTSISIILSSVIIAAAILITGRNGISNYKGPSAQGNAAVEGATQPDPAGPSASIDQIKKIFTGNGIKFGDENRKVLFVEVADPSCPYCHIAAGKNPELNDKVGSQFKLAANGGTYVAPVPEMKRLVDEGKASFTWIYTNGHGNGEMASEALYCGYENGKFWEVHDLLMSNAGYTTVNDVVKNERSKSQELATFLSSAIDPQIMKTCLDSGKYTGRLSEDSAVASSLGINGTPGFYVNTKNFAGAYSFKDMESIVSEALSK